MKIKTLLFKQVSKAMMLCGLVMSSGNLISQTLAFPEAMGFGKNTLGARGNANPQIYLVTNLNDSGLGSFRDAVSKPGRFVLFKVGGIINLNSAIAVAANTTIAGQTAPGEGIVLLGKVSFSGSSNTIARYLRIRYGDNTQGQDASGISNGANIILDHMTFTWGTDEVFSINWDNKGTSPDNITLQNCIIGHGLHRHNHSAGGLMQPSNGGKISLIGNLYIGNKTRNNKIKGINEFVNNVVYNWGNYGNTYGHTESGDAYIMGGDSAGSSDVNIINNYFIGGPNTSNSVSSPFNRGNSNFSLYGSGNYFDNNKNGILDGTLVPSDLNGYPVENASSILPTPYDYPMKNPSLSALDAYNKIVANVGASYPRRDQVDNLMISDLISKGTTATYMYDRSSFAKQFGFINNGVGHIYGAPAPLDTDNDGIPDVWEDANGLNKNAADALEISTTHAPYLNIEVYINGLINQTPPDFFIPPSNVNFTNVKSTEVPAESSLIVNWIDNATSETNNVLERSTDGINFTIIATLGPNVTSYNDTQLIPNTLYYYRIKATNATQSSDYASASVTTPPIPSVPTKTVTPTPTSALNNVELVNSTLSLKWTGSSNTTTYSVHFGTDPANLNKLGDVAYVAAPTYALTALSPGATYYWRVDSSNAKGTMIGDLWSFRTLKAELVGHWPFKEAAGDGEQIADISSYANDGQVEATFDNATVRVSGKANNAIDFATLLPNKLMVSVPNQDHLFFDKNSFTVSFWMKADATLIPAGTTLSSYLLCKGSMIKNATTGATGKRFNVEIKSNQLRFAIDDDKTKTELTSTLAATKYFTGDWVNVVIMRDVNAKKLRLYTNGVFTNEVNDATGTAIGIGEATDLVIGNIGALELYANTTPAPYKGKIDELKIFNYALSASEITTLYNTTVINVPSEVTLQTNSVVFPNPSSTVTLNWKDNSNNEANFIIEHSLDGISFEQIAEVGANIVTFTDTNLISNTKYYYRLKAINKTDSSTYSEIFNVTTPIDSDNDGYSNVDDCNDDDATVHEPILYYVDNDKDGFGSNVSVMLCSSVAPEGYATNNTDCDDNKILYADNDGDGLGSGDPVACGVENNDDCDDSNAIPLAVSVPDVYAINKSQEKNTIYIGYGSSVLPIKAIVTGGTAPYSYIWNTNETTQTIAIKTAGSYTVIITDAKGCQTSSSIDVNAINVQCGNSGDKVMVCHNDKEICISSNAVQTHLNHGDKLGSCDTTTAIGFIENITVFPNPVATILNVKVNTVFDGAELALYNILARKVKSEPLKTSMQQIDMNDLNKGVYFLHVKNGRYYTIKAIVKK